MMNFKEIIDFSYPKRSHADISELFEFEKNMNKYNMDGMISFYIAINIDGVLYNNQMLSEDDRIHYNDFIQHIADECSDFCFQSHESSLSTHKHLNIPQSVFGQSKIHIHPYQLNFIIPFRLFVPVFNKFKDAIEKKAKVDYIYIKKTFPAISFNEPDSFIEYNSKNVINAFTERLKRLKRGHHLNISDDFYSLSSYVNQNFFFEQSKEEQDEINQVIKSIEQKISNHVKDIKELDIFNVLEKNNMKYYRLKSKTDLKRLKKEKKEYLEKIGLNLQELIQ